MSIREFSRDPFKKRLDAAGCLVTNPSKSNRLEQPERH